MPLLFVQVEAEVVDWPCSVPSCQDVATIRCSQCGPNGQSWLCSSHDCQKHMHGHFHDRAAVVSGFLVPIPASTEFIGDVLKTTPKWFPYVPSGACNVCEQTDWGRCQPTNSELILVTINGRFDFVKSATSCNVCGNMRRQQIVDLLLMGFFPSTPFENEATTFISTELLSWWLELSHHARSLAVTSFINSLCDYSSVHGRVRTNLDLAIH